MEDEQIKGMRIRLNRLQVLKYHPWYKQEKWQDFITRQNRPPKNGSYFNEDEIKQICKELLNGMKPVKKPKTREKKK
jgi:hypothetical protein